MGKERQYLYKNYICRLSERFQKTLDHIEYIYGFDSGDEFEIAICQMLRSALPQKYGVCRGHLADQGGRSAGDDIIIYDRHLYPTLRLLPQEDFSRKEWVPIEAVYAYVEAKHTLDLQVIEPTEEGEREETETKHRRRSTLNYACGQLGAVKALCEAREKVPANRITRWLTMAQGKVTLGPNWPQYRNPMFGMILARFVRNKSVKPIEDPGEIAKLLQEHGLPPTHPPELVIAGDSNMMWPVGVDRETGEKCSPFVHEPGMEFKSVVAHAMAFGVGLCILFEVLDRISLGPLPWVDIIDDVFHRD